MAIRDVPSEVLDMATFAARVDERRAVLEAIESPEMRLIEFGIEGYWSGSRWRRTREFRLTLYVALQDADGQWIDHSEDLVRRRRQRDAWALVQPPERALEAAERFVHERLTASARWSESLGVVGLRTGGGA